MICGSVMNATMRISSPQRGQASGSSSKMRRSNSAHRLPALLSASGLGFDYCERLSLVALGGLAPHSPH